MDSMNNSAPDANVCPNCGYCPHCGRQAQPYPWYPYNPYPLWGQTYTTQTISWPSDIPITINGTTTLRS